MADVPENPGSQDPLASAEPTAETPDVAIVEAEAAAVTEPPAPTGAAAAPEQALDPSLEQTPDPTPDDAAPAAEAAPASEADPSAAAEPVEAFEPEAAAPAAIEAPVAEPVLAEPPVTTPISPTVTTPTTPTIAASLEVPPRPAAADAATAEGGEWDLLVSKVTAFLEGDNLQRWWNQLGGPLRTAGLLLALVVVLRLYGALLDTLGDLPLVPRLLQLAGLITVARFALTRLVRSEDRRAVTDDLRSRWQRFRGQG